MLVFILLFDAPQPKRHRLRCVSQRDHLHLQHFVFALSCNALPQSQVLGFPGITYSMTGRSPGRSLLLIPSETAAPGTGSGGW